MNKQLKELYQEERDKLSPLPDSDTDFIALDNAVKRLEESENGNL